MYVVNGLLFHIQNCLYMLTRYYIFIIVLGWGWGSAPKKVFLCFELFRARLAYKFAKSANMTPKTFSKYFQYGYKKTHKLMPIQNPFKKYQESLHKESWRAKNFCTQYQKVKKYIISTLLC